MSIIPGSLRVAVVHDWLYCVGGAERVLEQMLMLFPQADVFTAIDNLPPNQRNFLQGCAVHTSFIQNLPGGRTHHRVFLPLMPLAVEQFDLSGYDLVLSSSCAVAKGVITGPSQLHVSYVHSPMRYAWDLQNAYLGQAGFTGLKGWIARLMLHQMRAWDVQTANGVDSFVANSRFVAQRIRKIYRRDAEVIHPPIDVDSFQYGEDKRDYYLTVSRLVPYKRVDLIAAAFARMPNRRLVVIGDGPELARVRKVAGPNVEILGYQDGATVCRHMREARAFVFAAVEDFGIAPLEAQSCGTPVIALAQGGALETVRGIETREPTGVMFAEQTEDSLIEAVETFERRGRDIDPMACRRNAMRFNPARFRAELLGHVNQCYRGVGAPRELADIGAAA